MGRPYMYAILMRSDWTKQLSVTATRKHGCAQCCWSVSPSLGIDLVLRPVHYLLTRTVASGGGGRGSCSSPRTVEPDKPSLWVDLFSLESVILIVVTCICFPFSWGRIQTPYKVPAFGSRDNPPVTKYLATALLTWRKENLQRPNSLTIWKS